MEQPGNLAEQVRAWNEIIKQAVTREEQLALAVSMDRLIEKSRGRQSLGLNKAYTLTDLDLVATSELETTFTMLSWPRLDCQDFLKSLRDGLLTPQAVSWLLRNQSAKPEPRTKHLPQTPLPLTNR